MDYKLISSKSNIYFTYKCILCEVSGYPFDAPKKYVSLAQECKNYPVEELASQTKNKKLFDLLIACSNLSFHGHHLEWNKNKWLESSQILYNYFKAKTLLKVINDYEKLFNEQIIVDYHALLESFYQLISSQEEINYGSLSGVKSSISLVPITKLEEILQRFKELYE